VIAQGLERLAVDQAGGAVEVDELVGGRPRERPAGALAPWLPQAAAGTAGA
jgi:hypothetical protein